MTSTAPEHDLAPIFAALPPARAPKALAGAALVLGGQAMIWLTDAIDLFSASGIVVTILGAAIVYDYVRSKNPLNAPLVRALSTRPLDVVWVYDRAVWQGSVQAGEVHVHLEDRHHTVLTVRRAADTARLVEIIKQRAPAATFGWDRETEERFTKDPASLVQRRRA